MGRQRYKYWTREELHNHLERQALDYKADLELVKLAVWSEDWDPSTEFNGCNLIQDDLHPFLPCFIHDYEFIVLGNGQEANERFKANLLKFGFSKLRANIFYIAVTIGWYCYYQFKNRK